MCFLRFSFVRILFLCDKCCRRCPDTYGECTRLLLQLLVLQPCMEGMVLGVPTKVPDVGIVFTQCGLLDSQRAHRLNLIDAYQTRPSGPRLLVLCVCVSRMWVRLCGG